MGELITDWGDNPPLVFLVEALVYGLSGGKKKKAEYHEEATSSEMPRFPPPPAAVPIRGSGLPLPDKAEIIQHMPQGMSMVTGQKKTPGPQPILDFDSMAKLNQEMIIEMGKRKSRVEG